MHIIRGIPCSAASKIESLQNAAGTKIKAAFGWSSIDSATELNTGLPRCSVPPFPGVTPPIICVP